MKYKYQIFIVTVILVFSVSYYIIDQAMLRATQLANNTMLPEYDSKSLIYAVTITVVYSVLYFLFVREVGGEE